MLNLPLTKKYSCGDIAYFYAECARRFGEQVEQGVIKKDKVFDACIVDFINHQISGDFGMYTSDMYLDESKISLTQKTSYEYVSNQDIPSIVVMSKYRYLKDVSLACKQANNLAKSVCVNSHMHEDLTGEKITNEIVENNVDKFLLFVGRLRGVEITPDNLKLASVVFKLEQSKPLEEPSTSTMS